MTEPAKDEAELVERIAGAIIFIYRRGTISTAEATLAAIRAAWEDFKDDEGPTLTLEEIANVE